MMVWEDIIRRQDGSEGLYGMVRKADFSLVIPYEPGAFYLVDQCPLAAHALLQVHGLGPFSPLPEHVEE